MYIRCSARYTRAILSISLIPRYNTWLAIISIQAKQRSREFKDLRSNLKLRNSLGTAGECGAVLQSNTV